MPGAAQDLLLPVEAAAPATVTVAVAPAPARPKHRHVSWSARLRHLAASAVIAMVRPHS